jgi:hypothetical protein
MMGGKKASDSSNRGWGFIPVVIIGAPRSGTNILRDMLTSLPSFSSWPCDEINGIWTKGNLGRSNDELSVKDARPSVKKYIRNKFQQLWIKNGKPSYVVEKTCANTLRVPFVISVLPEAKFIQIVRNGNDVIKSAKKRWKGELEFPLWPYLLAKLRFTPLSSIPYYAWSYLISRIKILLGEKRLSTWGPRFEGIEQLSNHSVEDLCAMQWGRCLRKSDSDLAGLPTGSVLTIRYENLVTDPGMVLASILQFLDTDSTTSNNEIALSAVRKTSVVYNTDYLDLLSAEVIREISPMLGKYGPLPAN